VIATQVVRGLVLGLLVLGRLGSTRATTSVAGVAAGAADCRPEPQPSGSLSEPFCRLTEPPRPTVADRVAAAPAPPAAGPAPMTAAGAAATGAAGAAPVAAAMALAPRLPTVLTPEVATVPATLAAWVAALTTAGLFTTDAAVASAVCTGSPWNEVSADCAGDAVPAPSAIGGGAWNSPGVVTTAVVAAS